MGIVYEVVHEFTGDRLALKILKEGAWALDDTKLGRFRREARVSALVKSEHIVRVLDADLAPELDGAPFLVMDLLEGTNLAALAGNTPQPPDQVVTWLRQVARALDRAHQMGVIHRDLKPENLFLTKSSTGEAQIKILDFGVAKICSAEDVVRSGTGAVVGTPRYMSPEQASGGVVGPDTDVWAIGLIAFRLLAGKDYWSGFNVSRLLAEIVYAEILPPSAKGADLGADFDQWFLRSCARDPAERWSSVTDQIEALASALGLSSPALRSGPELPRAPIASGAKRGRVDVVITGVAFCVAIAATALLFRPRPLPPPPPHALASVSSRPPSSASVADSVPAAPHGAAAASAAPEAGSSAAVPRRPSRPVVKPPSKRPGLVEKAPF